MSDVLENRAAEASSASAVGTLRQQRYLILSLMVFSLTLGIIIGAVVTHGVFADPDNRIGTGKSGRPRGCANACRHRTAARTFRPCGDRNLRNQRFEAQPCLPRLYMNGALRRMWSWWETRREAREKPRSRCTSLLR